jgi:hypothetical protein
VADETCTATSAGLECTLAPGHEGAHLAQDDVHDVEVHWWGEGDDMVYIGDKREPVRDIPPVETQWDEGPQADA